MTARPVIRLQPRHASRFRNGSPWIYSNEIVMDGASKALPPGTVADLADDRGTRVATVTFNPHSLIAARVLANRPGVTIDTPFFRERIRRALGLRRKLYAAPFYRLVHAESDLCPGLVVDRFDDVLVAQSGTAGMDVLAPFWVEALRLECSPRSIVIRSNSPSRAHERLGDDVRIAWGEEPGTCIVEEGGIRHPVDVMSGQKTGWYFDQRDNRAFLVELARDTTLLDAFSYTGALALAALKAGALGATLLDASQPALDTARDTATRHGLTARATFTRCDVMEDLEKRAPDLGTFGVVSCDPPPFVRSRRDLESGARGYRKLARTATPLVEPGGFLCVASCSHGIDMERFQQESAAGIARTGRTARLIRAAGASPDHPVHPMLPETAYLKSLVYQVD